MLFGATATAKAEPRLAGIYHCLNIRRGSQVLPCAGPPLILSPQGVYQLGTKFGVYSIRGDRLVLSGLRRNETARLGRGREIVFEYNDRGRVHRVEFRAKARQPRGQVLL